MTTYVEGPDGFASSSAQLQAYARRTLDFLTVIENTVSGLATNRDVVVLLNKECKKTLGRIKKSHFDSEIDPDGCICDSLTNAAAVAERLYNSAVQRRAMIRENAAITTEDGLDEAFTGFIAAVADFHNVLEDLRDAILTLDASREPSTGTTFRSADELLAHLLKH